MHFDQRAQRALREVGGLTTDEIREVPDAVAEATRRDAERLEAFFAGVETVYSDMDRAHSASEYPEHDVEYLDLYTDAADIRGYLRFDTLGAPVEGGRILDDDFVQLALGPTVNGRVRFALDRDRF